MRSFNLSHSSETVIHEGGGELIAISKDCKWVANATDNALNPELFDIKGGGKRPLSGGHGKKIVILCASLYDSTFASGDESGFLRLWDFDKTDPTGGLQVFDNDPIDAIAFSPCKRLIVCSGNNGEIKIFEYKSDKIIKEPRIEIMHFSAKGKRTKGLPRNNRSIN